MKDNEILDILFTEMVCLLHHIVFNILIKIFVCDDGT